MRGDERGLITPALLGTADALSEGVVADGTSTPQHRIYHGAISSGAMEVRIPWDATAAVTVDPQLISSDGLTTTSVQASPPGVSGVLVFRWLHQQPLGQNAQFDVMTRRASGAGTLTIRGPISWTSDPSLATVTGL